MNNNTSRRASGPARRSPAPAQPSPRRCLPILPVLPVFFVLVWLWSAVFYGDVLRTAREHSFWVAGGDQMQYVLSQGYGLVWYAGRMALQLFRYPWLGGLLLAALLTWGSWLVGYSMRLSPRWRWVQYLPALAYVAVVSYEGLNIFFETETGRLLGIPILIVGILMIWGAIIRSMSRKPVPALCGVPRDESRRDNLLQLGVCLAGLAACVGFSCIQRPTERVICRMMVGQAEQDWEGMQHTARANAHLSHRAIAAYYAMALVQTDQIGERVYDLRMDYDSLYIRGWDGKTNLGNNLYVPEGNYYAGLAESCYHYTFERMVMGGPTVHGLQMLTKCALLRGEWELARKYLRILSDVPFEGAFCKKYSAMVGHPDRVNADPEMAAIRPLEPIRDSFENLYQQPTFMGYNLRLYEGRSINALKNSLAVCLYTKLMPDFASRLRPFVGATPPSNFADGILLASRKFPELEKMFGPQDFRATRLAGFLQEVQPYMKDRPRYAKELFPKYKGYYPYYYFFGNLKATKKRENTNATSNSGVN